MPDDGLKPQPFLPHAEVEQLLATSREDILREMYRRGSPVSTLDVLYRKDGLAHLRASVWTYKIVALEALVERGDLIKVFLKEGAISTPAFYLSAREFVRIANAIQADDIDRLGREGSARSSRAGQDLEIPVPPR